MHSILREFLQGAVGWLTVFTALVAASAALFKAFLPLVKEIRLWQREKGKNGNRETPPQVDENRQSAWQAMCNAAAIVGGAVAVLAKKQNDSKLFKAVNFSVADLFHQTEQDCLANCTSILHEGMSNFPALSAKRALAQSKLDDLRERIDEFTSLLRPKARVKRRPLVVGLVLLFISAGAFNYVTKPPQISVSEERTNAAWDYFKKGEPNPIVNRPYEEKNLNRAIELANSVVTDLEGPAKAKQQSLFRDGSPMPLTGEVSAEQRRTIFAYGPLNDVATCLWIKGRASQYLGKTNDVVLAYQQLTNYPYARTWDVKGWFWSPSEDATGRLSTITNAVPQH